MRNVARGLEEVVEGARRRPGSVIKRCQLAVMIGTHTQGLPRWSPVSHGTEHLLPTEHQLDRPSHHAGRHDAENLRSGDQAFGAEAAAQERTADVDLVWGNPEKSGETPLRHGKTLARRVD